MSQKSGLDITERKDLTYRWLNPLTVLIMLGIFAICMGSRNHSYIYSDPLGTLAVSDMILTHGTLKLDEIPNALKRYGGRAHEVNGHIYYYFPIGSSLASLPVVLVAKILGMDVEKSEPLLQALISSGIAVVIYGLLIKLASKFISRLQSVLLASVFWFGTALSSTAGTALWSHDFTVLFATLTLYYLAVEAKSSRNQLSAPALSFLFFLCYLCRPTMSIFIATAIALLGTFNIGKALRVIAGLSVLLGCFFLFSNTEFGKLLPDYYQPTRIGKSDTLVPLYGNLFSPARGLFIFSPFLLFSWGFLLRGNNLSGMRWWWIVSVIWPLSHLLLISTFPHWWGGHAYGPRLLTDVLPGLFLLTLSAWPTSIPDSRKIIFGLGLLACSAAASIYINTIQGLLNPFTSAWNRNPNIDDRPELVFDWKYPQFLATEARNRERVLANR